MLEADVLCGGDSRYYFVRGYVAGSTISKVVDVRWQGGGEFIGLKDDRAPGSSKCLIEQMRNEMRKMMSNKGVLRIWLSLG